MPRGADSPRVDATAQRAEELPRRAETQVDTIDHDIDTLSSDRPSSPDSDTASLDSEIVHALRNVSFTAYSRMEQQIADLQSMVTQMQNERIELYKRIDATGGPAPADPVAFMPVQPAFLQDWHRRTEARRKLICRSNRAGNALCAWHDGRRERRTYPPRMAPNGLLNCGCSEEEALFEESLARNGVGSYRPAAGGNVVRMDPGLRRPLLELLKRRYGYKDGDFEIDIASGTWGEEEDSVSWETRLAAEDVARTVRIQRLSRSSSSHDVGY